ncbi:divalent cation tolerance protein CutA [Candidatus Dependentiae bacterium]|nr:divalent cation tolerance protein CutA [Candidatus Dependentiae bacterium]
MIFIYITCATKEQAEKIAFLMLKSRLVACANIFPVNSLYWWNDKIENDNEFVLILKSLDKNFDQICTKVKQNHSYDVPCIIKIQCEADNMFLNFAKKKLSEK